MNRILIILSLLVFITQHIRTQDKYFFYNFREKKVLTRTEDYLTVVFRSDASKKEVEDLYDKHLKNVCVNKYFVKTGVLVDSKVIMVCEMKNNTDATTLDVISNELRKNSKIVHTGFSFRVNGKVRHLTTNEIIIRFKKNISASIRQDLSRLFKTQNEQKIDFFDNVYVYSIHSNGERTDENVFDVSNKYALLDFVEFAQPNFIRIGMLLSDEMHVKKNPFWPDDSLLSMMWHIKNTGNNIPNNVQGIPGCDISGELAWNISTGNPKVMIAITDTGIDTNHLDIRPNLCDRNLWYDAYDEDQKPFDEHFHGTGVSGVAIAAGNNRIGTAGVGFNCQVMPVRVFGPYPLAMTTDLILAKGINWSWQHGAVVINCSWGGGIPTPLINHAIQNAVRYGRNNRGTVICAGAGNDNIDTLLYPASMPEVMGIGGLSPCYERKSLLSCDNVDSLQQWGASYGEGLSVVAPTTYIGTTELFGGWCICGNGTSVSSPIAAGIVGLILSKNINLSGDSVRLVMEKSARKIGNYSYNILKQNGLWNYEMGYGAIDAKSALDMTPQGPGIIYNQIPPYIDLYAIESGVFHSSISMSAFIKDDEAIAGNFNKPRLYFYTNSSPNVFIVTGNYQQNDIYSFVIPAIGYGTKVFYYIAAQDTSSNGNITTYPLGGNGVNPPGTLQPAKLMFLQNTDYYDTTFYSTNVPIVISADRETTIVSNLSNPFYKTILDVNCTVDIDHDYDADITVSLISPSGYETVLTGGVGNSGNNFTYTTFDDEASVSIDDTNYFPPYSGSFKPVQKLWFLDGENSFGNWMLKIVDNGRNDGGLLKSWNIRVRYSKSYEENNIPDRFSLIGNYPNPFNPSTRILFNVSRRSRILIKLYDVLGREVAVILNSIREPRYSDFVDFSSSSQNVNSGKGLASGIYFYAMYADDIFIEAKRMNLLK